MKYKGCARFNKDTTVVMKYTASSYYRSKLDFNSYLENNNITKFMHRVFYFMHEKDLTRKVSEHIDNQIDKRDYLQMTKAMLANIDFDADKSKYERTFKSRSRHMHNGHKGYHRWTDNTHDKDDPCTCKLCHDDKAKEVVKYFDDLDKNQDRTYNGYNTKSNLIKYIVAKKSARYYFNKYIDDQGIYLKHGIVSQITATRAWSQLFPKTSAIFDVVPLRCKILKDFNRRTINGFGLQNEPTVGKDYYSKNILQISPTYFYKVFMKGFAKTDVEINSNRVFIADVKLLKQDKEISDDPKMKLYRAMGYTALHGKVTKKNFYTILTYQNEDGHGDIEMNVSNHRPNETLLPNFIPPKVHISGIEKEYEMLTSTEKRRMARMIEQRIVKSNLKVINAI